MDARLSSPSFESNRGPIFEVLGPVLRGLDGGHVIEVGCGSGQHACWFGERLPGWTWTPTDLPDQLASARAWRADAERRGVDNVAPTVGVDLLRSDWDSPLGRAGAVDAVVCINVVHIVAWSGTLHLLDGAARLLRPGGLLYLYGPYRYEDRPLEPSNEQFDRWLGDRVPNGGGIKSADDLCQEAAKRGLELVEDRAMPKNNRSIWFRLAARG